MKLLESAPLSGHMIGGGATLDGARVSIGDVTECGSARKKASETQKNHSLIQRQILSCIIKLAKL